MSHWEKLGDGYTGCLCTIFITSCEFILFEKKVKKGGADKKKKVHTVLSIYIKCQSRQSLSMVDEVGKWFPLSAGK